MSILGYSERGIVNSLIYTIGECEDRLKEFIELIVPKIEIEDPIGYEILLEQSFSNFGTSDLIIMIRCRKPEDNKVLFFEAKVKAHRNWNIVDEYNDYQNPNTDNHSNLFYQLVMKKKLIKNYNENGIIRVQRNEYRWITTGDNPVIIKAIKKMRDFKEAYYIGIIPDNDIDIETFKMNILEDVKFIRFVSWRSIHSFCIQNNLDKVNNVFDFNIGQIY